MSDWKNVKLIVYALDMAIRIRCSAYVIHHANHGAEYTSLKFRQAPAAANVTLFMESVGGCSDNDMMESLFASLETDLIDRQPRRRFRFRAKTSLEVLLPGRILQSSTRVFSAGLSVFSSSCTETRKRTWLYHKSQD